MRSSELVAADDSGLGGTVALLTWRPSFPLTRANPQLPHLLRLVCSDGPCPETARANQARVSRTARLPFLGQAGRVSRCLQLRPRTRAPFVTH